MTVQNFNPPGVIQPVSAYANCVVVPAGHKTIYIAGQVGVDQAGRLTGDGGVEAQVRQTFENIRLCVEAAKGAMGDIVSIMLYLSDIADAKIVSHVRGEYFPGPILPASTLIGGCTFLLPELKFEANAVAALPT